MFDTTISVQQKGRKFLTFLSIINALMMNVQAYIRQYKCQDPTRYDEANFEPLPVLHDTKKKDTE